MWTYRRIEEASDLPPEGPVSKEGRETDTLDFKEFADKAKGWEHAKDIAAFANHLGGVLLIGASEGGGRIAYPGLRGQDFTEVKRIFEQAAQQLCSPSPVVDVIPVERNGAMLAAVNVAPFVDQPVAARAATRDKNGKDKAHDEAWVFPIRVSSQTSKIEPEKLPMYMNREIRRAVLLLEGVPEDQRHEVTVYFHTVHHTHTHLAGQRFINDMKCSLERVSVERNALTLGVYSTGTNYTCAVPLLDVEDVWEHKKASWSVRIAGQLQGPGAETRAFEYLPLPR